MKKAILIIAVGVMLLSLSATAVFARGQRNPVGERMTNCQNRGPQKGNLFADLKLTETQLNQFEQLRFEFEKDTIDLRFELRTKQRELHKLWSERPLNQKNIDVKTKDVNTLRIKLTQKRDVLNENLKKVLTEEQLKLFQDKSVEVSPCFKRGGPWNSKSFSRELGNGQFLVPEPVPEK